MRNVKRRVGDPPQRGASSKPARARDFDRRLWHRFLGIARLYWASEEKWHARALLLLLVGLLLGRTELTVLYNQQSGELTSALAARDAPRFWASLHAFVLALVAGVPVYAVYYYARDLLGISWRRWLTRDYASRYLSHRAFYRLTSEQHIDNPDQRIAEDVNGFTQKSLKVLVEVVGAVLQLLAFSGILWSISRGLVWLLVGYAALGTALSLLVFGKPLIRLNFQQLRREGDFRYALVRVRENAEAIAFYRGESPELGRIDERFQQVFDNFKALLRRTLGLNFFQYAYTFATYALPSAILAPRVLSGELEVGRVVQAAGAFASMLGALTIFVDNFELLSGFAAGVDRLYAFGKAFAPPPVKHGTSATRIESRRGATLQLRQLCVQTPDRARTLVSELSLAVGVGDAVLIVGPSGCGKSSLLRAIAGLWDTGSGAIVRPPPGQMMFLPQRPYMVLGTLRDQLLYPALARAVPDEELERTLSRVNLPQLLERCGGLDVELDFGKLLSVGEQQRLSVARALLARPRYLLLDEATSALDTENEQALYDLLREAGCTLLSVAHRPELARYHRRVLELMGDGDWQVRAVAREAQDLHA